MSHLGWVDFSSTDREKVTQVLAMLWEPGTLDELGIGQVRDAFADLLFPGFSTIQTRAKYFITVPRIIRDYYALDVKLQKRLPLLAYLEEKENLLAKLLVELHGDSEDGIIGSTLVGTDRGVARRPSSVYWNGLRQFGLINTRCSLAEFARQPKKLLTSKGGLPSEDDDEDVLAGRHLVHLDHYIPQWREDLSIKLGVSEAQFLVDKLTHQDGLKHSVVSQLLIHDLGEEALGKEFKNFPALAHWLKNQKDVSEVCRRRLDLAREFSDAMAGAHLRYNILIARKSENLDLVEQYEKKFTDWRVRVGDEGLFKPGRADTWLESAADGPSRFKTLTHSFVRHWAEALAQDSAMEILDRMVEHQAKRNKGRRSLLHRNLGDTPNWQGMDELSYRWPSVRVILGDIMEGLPC